MKIFVVSVFYVMIFGFTYSIGQTADMDNMKTGSQKIKNAKGDIFVVGNPKSDSNLDYTILGTGSTSFSVSNTSDMTEISFNHQQRISMALTTANKNDNIELVFYSNMEELPYAVTQVNNKINIYYPLSMYESIKQKIDLALSAKKKIVLNVSVKANGFREAQLIF